MRRITRRKFLGQVAGTAAASLSYPAFAGPAKSAKPKANILFLMSDDMRVELGCYGSMFRAQTPNLDALAKSGVRFDRNYCQFPLCNPSRSSLMTSRRPTVTGVLGNRTDFRTAHPEWISLPQLFRENGYTSLRTGKIFHGNLDDPKAWTIGGGRSEPDGGAGGKNKKIVPRGSNAPPSDIIAPVHPDSSQADQSVCHLALLR